MIDKRDYYKLKNHPLVRTYEESRGIILDLDYLYEEIEKRKTTLSKIDKNVLFNIVAFHVLDIEDERRVKK